MISTFTKHTSIEGLMGLISKYGMSPEDIMTVVEAVGLISAIPATERKENSEWSQADFRNPKLAKHLRVAFPKLKD